MLLYAVEGLTLPGERRGHYACAKDDHVESAWGGVIDPFCGKETDRVQGGEVAFFSVNEVVVCGLAEVIYAVDDEGVGGGADEEDDLGAAEGEVVDDCFADAGGSALEKVICG